LAILLIGLCVINLLPDDSPVRTLKESKQGGEDDARTLLPPVRTLTGHIAWVWSVSFSPDGSLLASGSVDKTIKLWRVSDGSLVRTLKGFLGFVSSVSFSPEGSLLASGNFDGTIKLWRVSDGSLVRTLTGHTGAVMSVLFSPDGSLLASGSVDKTIKLWQVR
jgi:WD40 repeat protein